MNKRTEAIRSLFAASPAPEALSPDSAPPELRRVAAGPVRSLKDSFSGVEQENERLRELLASKQGVITIDPALVDPSPVRDRFEREDDPAFELLRRSMAERGQDAPVLVREHPTVAGRYQAAYGHRRIRAAQELGLAVKAIVRALSDEELLVAQGVENSVRSDLSFIERAAFAARLEELGHKRSVIEQALSIDRAESTKLISVVRRVPAELIVWIGSAPKIGRPRWLELAELMEDKSAQRRALAVMAKTAERPSDSDRRFLAVLSAAAKRGDTDPPKATVVSANGRSIAKVTAGPRETRLAIDRTAHPDFADFVVGRLPELFQDFVASRESRGGR